MNAKELAEKMLAYGDAQEVANALKTEIETAVLDLEKTQTVGNVKAAFRNGRKSYDYKTAIISASDIHQDYFDENTKIIKKVDYRAMCKAVRIAQEDIPCTVGKPSVAVSLV